jgi:hypothetical protein
MQLAVKEWRVRFTVSERDVRVVEIFSGFRASQLAAEHDDDAALKVHRDFVAMWLQRPPSA